MGYLKNISSRLVDILTAVLTPSKDQAAAIVMRQTYIGVLAPSTNSGGRRYSQQGRDQGNG